MRLLRVLACCTVLWVPVSAAAQPRPSPDEFVAVADVPESEQIPAIRLVATAYGFIWIVMLGYVWTVGRRLRAVEAGLAELEHRAK